jgi:hypothetical protein
VSTHLDARRRGYPLAVALALVGSLLVVTGAGTAANAACRVVNATAPSVNYSTLQAAVDAASAGDTLLVRGTCTGTTTIVMSLTIAGRPRATLDGNHLGSVITIEGASGLEGVTLRDLTITHGTATLDGGGVRNFGSRLTLIDSTVTANTAPRTGGGIQSDHGTVILRDTTVSHNSAASGGGISNGTNGLRLFGSSSVHHNTASGLGGGIANADGSTALNDDSSVHHNTAAEGGGLFNGLGGVLTLMNSASISANSATGDGGGVYNDFTGSLTLTDSSSISGNSAGGDGGGIWSSSVLTTLTNCVAGVNVVHNAPDDIFLAP